MAKSILDELEAIIGKDGVAKVKSNPTALAAVAERDRLYSFYTGEEDEPDAAAAEATRLAQEEADRKRMADKAEADRIAATARNNTTSSGSTAEMTAVLSQLTELNKTLAELNKFKETAITVDKLPGYESTILRKTHELTLITNSHEKEFSEPLDLTKLDEWVTEQKKTGAGWPSITAAYNSWVQDKRIEARVQKEVAEQVKQKVSSAAVPAQTHTASMSPAQQIIADAKKVDNSGGKTNAMKAAERMATLERAREGGAAA
jgi:predicted DNA binding CopG/RHH family protein